MMQLSACPRWIGVVLPLLLAIPTGSASAAGFAMLITPPRFELRARPGDVLRQIIEVSNVATSPARVSVGTAEWRFAEDGSVLFENALADDSCRPWIALEARQLELPASGRRRYRFEVEVPLDAAARECRFAIMFEGEPERVGDLGLPVAGRIGIIVYLAIGDPTAQLRLESATQLEVDGQRLPALTVTNTGDAHTRLEGLISGRDSSGREIVFAPDSAPVLPGQTRNLVLRPQAPSGQVPPVVAYPIRLSGRLDWSGQRLEIDETFGAE